jgi:ATP-binding cassette, subfamily B, bacterial
MQSTGTTAALEGGLVRLQRDPDKDASHRSLDRVLIGRILGLMRPYRVKRNWLFLVVLLRSVQQPAFVWAVAATINGPIAQHQSTGSIVLAALGVLALSAVMQITLHFRQRLTLEIGEAVVNDLRCAVFTHLQSMPMSFYHKTKVGRIISRINGDCDAVRIGVQDVLFVSMVGLGQMLFTALLMLWFDPVLFAIVFAMAPVLWGLNRLFQSRLTQAYREIQESFSRVTSTLAESVAGIRVTQGFSRSEKNAELFSDLVVSHADYNMKATWAWGIFNPLLELNSAAVTAAIIAVGGWRVLSPDSLASIGDLIQFMFLTGLFFTPVQILGTQYNQALAAMAGAERVFGILDQKPQWSDIDSAVALPPLQGRLTVENVTFAYDSGTVVLHDVSFDVSPGQRVALVGPTGSGKSTILSLLARFYIPTHGRILLDGVDTRGVTRESIASQVAMVLQQNYLFTGTIRDNLQIAIGMSSAPFSDEQIYAALESMECRDLVEGLPHGLDTKVGGRGSKLSLGQRQLICFARALLANPRVLILDEATSAIDTMTEVKIQRSLQRLLSGRTCFIVAHRLSTIKNVDEVLVIDHGKIIQRGTHAKLIQQPGMYQALVNRYSGMSTIP